VSKLLLTSILPTNLVIWRDKDIEPLSKNQGLLEIFFTNFEDLGIWMFLFFDFVFNVLIIRVLMVFCLVGACFLVF